MNFTSVALNGTVGVVGWLGYECYSHTICDYNIILKLINITYFG